MTDQRSPPLLLATGVASELKALLLRYGMRVECVAPQLDIPGSFWGDSEAGLIAETLYLRDDTPLHSALHEAAHFVCMTPERRAALDTNAGGDELEECAVCYLQILLAARIEGAGSDQIMRDMDAWGYSFRLGSTERWFHGDAEDARQWLLDHDLVDAEHGLTFRLRVGA